MNEPAILDVRDLCRSFQQGQVVIDVLRGIDLTLVSGEIVALLGPSGSGKSTLLQAVGLLEGGFTGHIGIDGVSAEALDNEARTRMRREKLGFIYQFHHLLPDFTAIENIILPQLVAGRGEGEARSRADDLLQTLGLAARATHKPSKLSGGEQQRVAVARALANRPRLILADEPTGNLDEATAERVFAEFVALVRAEGSAALVATHNEALALRMDRIVRLADGVLDHAAITGSDGAQHDGAQHDGPQHDGVTA